MDPSTLPDTAGVRALQAAVAAGALAFVDADARPQSLAEAFDRRTWAHLRDVANGQVHVQALRAGRELLGGSYLAMLGHDV